jgi:DNA-binding transcriptional MerR regulator
MFNIGDFARHGRVSIRMLRHYDAVGLLRPARVNPASGYRCYEADQLAQLNRIMTLKDLGFTLEQVRAMLDEQVGVEQLRGMLTLRRAELEAALAGDALRLTQVEARLRTIESEGQMPANEVVVKRIPATLVAELTDTAASFGPEDIGPIVKPLCAELGHRLAGAGVLPTGRLTCYYEKSSDGDDRVIVHAAVPVAVEPSDTNGLTITELAGADSAATIVHRGSMDNVMPTWQTMARWIDANGYRSRGYPRELYLECPDDADKWVTELQEPITSN